MGLLNEYEEVLVGSRQRISQHYFSYDKKGNERTALSVIRYAIENLLGWDKTNAINLLNPNYLHFMKLDQMLNYILFPSDVTKDDTEYLLYLLYPRSVDYNVKKYTLRVYENVLAGKTRYPKDYMYGWLGILRAKICLQYSINKNCMFRSADELYSFFASKDCIKYLKKNKLYQLYNSFYSSPLEYMHESMPSSVKNEFLYHNYKFNQLYGKTVERRKNEKQGK